MRIITAQNFVHRQMKTDQFLLVLTDLFCFTHPRPTVFYAPQLHTNYMLVYSTLLCKKIARASGAGGYKPTKFCKTE